MSAELVYSLVIVRMLAIAIYRAVAGDVNQNASKATPLER